MGETDGSEMERPRLLGLAARVLGDRAEAEAAKATFASLPDA